MGGRDSFVEVNFGRAHRIASHSCCARRRVLCYTVVYQSVLAYLLASERDAFIHPFQSHVKSPRNATLVPPFSMYSMPCSGLVANR